MFMSYFKIIGSNSYLAMTGRLASIVIAYSLQEGFTDLSFYIKV